MTEGTQRDRRGTFWDWPVGVAIAGVLLFFIAAGNGGAAGVLLGLVMAVGGLVAWLARRGSFSPRR